MALSTLGEHGNMNRRNWDRAIEAIDIARTGLETFTLDVVETFRLHILNTIIREHGLQPGTTCSQCNTHNVLPCGQRKEICSTDAVCRFHSTQATKYKQCQQNVCHRMYEKIRNHHISNRPSLGHTDATKWCTDGWEIAKCYFKFGNNQTGDSDTTSATEMTGLLKLIKNCKFFGSSFGTNWQVFLQKVKNVSPFILSFN